MRPIYPGRYGNRPLETPKAESNFSFEEKLKHIRAAYAKKIAEMGRVRGEGLTEAEKQKIGLTMREYDGYRDKEKSLSGDSISERHTWNYALEQAGIPLLSSRREHSYRNADDVYSSIMEFKTDFKKRNGCEPTQKDYFSAQDTSYIPKNKAIKANTGSRTLRELLIRLGYIGLNKAKRQAAKWPAIMT